MGHEVAATTLLGPERQPWQTCWQDGARAWLSALGAQVTRLCSSVWRCAEENKPHLRKGAALAPPGIIPFQLGSALAVCRAPRAPVPDHRHAPTQVGNRLREVGVGPRCRSPARNLTVAHTITLGEVPTELCRVLVDVQRAGT